MTKRPASLVVALALLAPAAAQADTLTGGTSITLGGPTATQLKRAGGSFVATAPATASPAKLDLPAQSGTTRAVDHGGVLQIRTKRARLNLVALKTTVSTTAVTSALVGGKRIPLFTYAGRPAVDDGSARLIGVKVRLTGVAAKAIRQALGAKGLRGGRIGTANLVLSQTTGPTGAPAPVTATPGAQSVVWRPRESFVRYMNSETGKLFASGNAQDGAREVRPGSDAPLVYSFLFSAGTGTLNATWQERGIDLTFTDPVVGPGATTFSVVFGGQTSGSYNGQRVGMLALDPGKASSHTTGDGTESYTDIPAVLTEDGSKAFAGFYAPGDEFGTVSFTRRTSR